MGTSACPHKVWFFLLYRIIVLTASNSDGTIHVDTLYSRLLGKPPIMVTGITPSTVKAGFVSAILSACRACRWWPLQSRCHSRQCCQIPVPNSSWRWYYSQLAIHQSTSVHVPVALVAGNEKGGAADQGFPCHCGHCKCRESC